MVMEVQNQILRRNRPGTTAKVSYKWCEERDESVKNKCVIIN